MNWVNNKYRSFIKRKSSKSAVLDSCTFGNWHKCAITTKECYEEFVRNNVIGKDEIEDALKQYDEEEFKEFMAGYGYVKG